MTTTSPSAHQQSGKEAAPTTAPESSNALVTKQGRTSIADSVVAKIAGIATRDVAGVHSLGGGAARAVGAIRERIPGSSGPNVAQGVGVEVGETQAAIDLDIVVEYGVSIADLGQSIQRNVKQAVERMTALEVVEVNISVADVHLPSDDTESSDQESRVS